MNMNRSNIIQLPNPSLRRPSKTVSKVTSKIKKLASDMAGATLDWEDHREHEFGVALAAVQVNQNLRVVVIRRDFKDKSVREFDAYINPEITRYEGEPKTEVEGCLSVKDIYGEVKRYPKVKIKATDLEGRTVKKVVKGFLAQVFQHEIDHTMGYTFIDRCGHDGKYYRINSDGTMQELSVTEKKAFLSKTGRIRKAPNT